MATKTHTPAPAPADEAAKAAAELAAKASEGTEGTKAEGTDKPTEGTKKDDSAKMAGELDLDFLASGGVMLAEALVTETMPVRQRNERQMVMDTKVKALHEAWTAKGKVGDWNSLVKAGVVATYFLEPDKSAKFKGLVNKAATFHSVRVRYGSSFVVTEAHISRFGLKPEYLGREAISFAILDKKARTTSAANGAEAKADEADEADES